MKPLDVMLQRWRISKARHYLRPGDEVLDIGSADGALFRQFPLLGRGMGIDPQVKPEGFPSAAVAIRGEFPRALPEGRVFDALTAMAVLEHIPASEQADFARACRAALRPRGLVLLTVPSPRIDHLLDWLLRLRLIDGMETAQHYGFEPDDVEPLFERAGFVLVSRESFELGLNTFFAFRRP